MGTAPTTVRGPCTSDLSNDSWRIALRAGGVESAIPHVHTGLHSEGAALQSRAAHSHPPTRDTPALVPLFPHQAAQPQAVPTVYGVCTNVYDTARYDGRISTRPIRSLVLKTSITWFPRPPEGGQSVRFDQMEDAQDVSAVHVSTVSVSCTQVRTTIATIHFYTANTCYG